MYISITVGYSELLIPVENIGSLLKDIEKAKVCKPVGYGEDKMYTILDTPVEIAFVSDTRVVIPGGKIHSCLEDLSKMTIRAWKAEEEKTKIQAELDALKLKFAPFMEVKKENEPVL